jgi:hypothetical protein
MAHVYRALMHIYRDALHQRKRYFPGYAVTDITATHNDNDHPVDTFGDATTWYHYRVVSRLVVVTTHNVEPEWLFRTDTVVRRAYSEILTFSSVGQAPDPGTTTTVAGDGDDVDDSRDRDSDDDDADADVITPEEQELTHVTLLICIQFLLAVALVRIPHTMRYREWLQMQHDLHMVQEPAATGVSSVLRRYFTDTLLEVLTFAIRETTSVAHRQDDMMLLRTPPPKKKHRMMVVDYEEEELLCSWLVMCWRMIHPLVVSEETTGRCATPKKVLVHTSHHLMRVEWKHGGQKTHPSSQSPPPLSPSLHHTWVE